MRNRIKLIKNVEACLWQLNFDWSTLSQSVKSIADLANQKEGGGT